MIYDISITCLFGSNVDIFLKYQLILWGIFGFQWVTVVFPYEYLIKIFTQNPMPPLPKVLDNLYQNIRGLSQILLFYERPMNADFVWQFR